MNTLMSCLRILSNPLLSIQELAHYLAIFLKALYFYPRAVLIARVLAAESQLGMYRLRIQQKKAPKPRFTTSFRILWVFLSKVWKGWEEYVYLIQPATMWRWHSAGFRLYWRWKSRKPGRPSTRLNSYPVGGGLYRRYERLAA